MQKISFYPSIFLAEETNTMAKQIETAIDSSKSTDETLLKAQAALKSSNGKLTGVLKAILANPFTKKLDGADGFRDAIYIGGRNVIEGFTHWDFDVAKKAVAESLLSVFKRHGWGLQAYGYSKQSSALNSLIKELKNTELQAGLATLGLSDWFAELVKSQEAFESIFNLKAGTQNSKESVEKREAQIPVNEDIEKLLTYLNSIIMFNTNNTEWNKIFNEVEGIVKQMTIVARARRSSQKPDGTIITENNLNKVEDKK
jgi:hypothetical protein